MNRLLDIFNKIPIIDWWGNVKNFDPARSHYSVQNMAKFFRIFNSTEFFYLSRRFYRGTSLCGHLQWPSLYGPLKFKPFAAKPLAVKTFAGTFLPLAALQLKAGLDPTLIHNPPSTQIHSDIFFRTKRCHYLGCQWVTVIVTTCHYYEQLEFLIS